MKKTTRHLIEEVSCWQSRVELTSGIDLGDVWSHYSTAFSPSDSAVLSRWAKVMMMVQAVISFVTVALLAVRAVNIL